MPDAMIVPPEAHEVSRIERFMLGALGGFLPVLAGLLAVDIATFIDTLDKQTAGVICGIFTHVFVLTILGGIMTILNREVSHPLTLVQLGIAAGAHRGLRQQRTTGHTNAAKNFYRYYIPCQCGRN
jgi:hypothetical protein